MDEGAFAKYLQNKRSHQTEFAKVACDIEDVVRDALRARQLFCAVSVFAGVMNFIPAAPSAFLRRDQPRQRVLLLRSIEVPWPLVEGFLRLKKEKMEEHCR